MILAPSILITGKILATGILFSVRSCLCALNFLGLVRIVVLYRRWQCDIARLRYDDTVWHVPKVNRNILRAERTAWFAVPLANSHPWS
jgi:hypothetical protein